MRPSASTAIQRTWRFSSFAVKRSDGIALSASGPIYASTYAAQRWADQLVLSKSEVTGATAGPRICERVVAAELTIGPASPCNISQSLGTAGAALVWSWPRAAQALDRTLKS